MPLVLVLIKLLVSYLIVKKGSKDAHDIRAEKGRIVQIVQMLQLFQMIQILQMVLLICMIQNLMIQMKFT